MRPQPLRTTRALSQAVLPPLHPELDVLRHLHHHTPQKLDLRIIAESVAERQSRKKKMSSISVKGMRLSKTNLIRSWPPQKRRARGPDLMHLQLLLVQQGADFHGRPTKMPNPTHYQPRKRKCEPRMSSFAHGSVPRAALCSLLPDIERRKTLEP